MPPPRILCLSSMSMASLDPRIVLRGREVGEEGDAIVDYPEQPRDYFHADGTVWAWQDSWRMVGGS
jgi:hypothetical protein